MFSFRRYISNLPATKIALWCYFIWYLAIAAKYFDPSPAIWLNALGISGVIGVALWLGVRASTEGRIDPWQIFRLFLTPFCVSSFSALIKGRGFVLIFPPRLDEFALAAGACFSFVVVVLFLKHFWGENPTPH